MRPALLALAVLLLPAPARADTVVLCNGNEIRGKIIREGADGVEIRIASGTIFLPRKSVRSVRRDRPRRELLSRARKAMTAGNDEAALDLLEEAGEDPALAAEARAELHSLLESRFDLFLRRGRIEVAEGVLARLKAAGASPASLAIRNSALEELRKDVEGALRRAPVLDGDGRAREAALCYEKVIRSYPGRQAELAGPAGAAFSAWADEVLPEDPARAAPLFTRAVRYNPNLFPKLAPKWSESRRAQAMRALQNGRHDEALRILEETTAAAPHDAANHRALAETLETLGRSDEALAAAQRAQGTRSSARASGPDPAGDDAPRVLRYPHFHVIQRGAEGGAAELAGAAEFHFERIGRAVGAAKELEDGWPVPAKLDVLDTVDAYRKASSFPEWSKASMFASWRNGKITEHGIRLVGIPESAFGAMLPHEIGHLVLQALAGSPSEVPLWIHEGFAQWCEPEIRKPFMRTSVEASVLLGETLPLRRLAEQTTYPETGLQAFYCQSFSVVDFLIGSRSPADFLSAARRSGSDCDSFARHLGFGTMEDLERAWKASVRAGALEADREPVEER